MFITMMDINFECCFAYKKVKEELLSPNGDFAYRQEKN